MKIKILEFILEFVGEVSHLALLSAGCIMSSLSLSLSRIFLSEIFLSNLNRSLYPCLRFARGEVFCFPKIL